ncbi:MULTISPECIES: quinone-dependent dihydroorotate dehydrogenase [Candidatus Ichthyocystis]|uniref:Dihydroorotate dehydrogenase (quinone) n=1 Tax=Candidatus Ichthyocystis hellenicum TaxID=1561003 RepID=A0A0S4M0Y3_9BURK|nr:MULTISPECIES: quinone-dependent dihydroorotate dehydrogenase [Ichthyocystis]CUT16896.1 Dihydroorotate dehydrogenase [Candidatus Ichthyocystis hellenicum]
MCWHKAYRLSRPLIKFIDPETAHDLSLKVLSTFCKDSATPPEIYPLKRNRIVFRNRIGLAAGFDKNGKHIDSLSSLGFGFIEVGTVTPKPEPGNTRPRLFRSFSERAIINRMGFNNDGIDVLSRRLKNSNYRKSGGVLGVNIGKNVLTTQENSHEDYLTCIEKVYSLCDYIAINISSPNTAGLRELQQHQLLKKLISKIKIKQQEMREKTGQHTPIFVKFSPDLSQLNISKVCEVLSEEEVEGIILTNTTTERPINDEHLQKEKGGLSGSPLMSQSTKVLKEFSSRLSGSDITIIGVGGICSAKDAQEKFDNGAHLIQLYSGLIFEGPNLINRCISDTLPQSGS